MTRPLIPPHKIHRSKKDYNRKREKAIEEWSFSQTPRVLWAWKDCAVKTGAKRKDKNT